MFHNKARLLLEQLNCESVCDNHEYHRHIECEKRPEDEKHSIVYHALLGLGHDVLVINDS